MKCDCRTDPIEVTRDGERVCSVCGYPKRRKADLSRLGDGVVDLDRAFEAAERFGCVRFIGEPCEPESCCGGRRSDGTISPRVQRAAADPWQGFDRRKKAEAAAARVRKELAAADAGNYGRAGWASYLDRNDVEAVLDFVLAPRYASGTTPARGA